MSEILHLLWFVEEVESREDTELLIGVYQTDRDAKAAVDRLKNKPGFADFPGGFQVVPYELNQDHWSEGFVRQ